VTCRDRPICLVYATLLLLDFGEAQGKGGARALLALNVNRTVVALDDTVDDGEA